MGLVFAIFLKFYEGAFSYIDILKMPYERFMMFYEYMYYIMNMETEEGRKENKREDEALERKMGLRKEDTSHEDIMNLKNMFNSIKKK